MDKYVAVPFTEDELDAVEKMVEFENNVRAFGPSVTTGEWVRQLVCAQLGLTKYSTVTTTSTTSQRSLRIISFS